MTKTENKRGLVPKLRFPEFRNAGEWQRSQLVDVCTKIANGGTPDTSKPEFWGGTINWMTPAEMGKTENPFIGTTNRTITELGLSNCTSDLLPLNTVILSVRAPIGHLAINTIPIAINQGCKGLIAGNSLNFYFLYCSLLNTKLQLINLGAGNTFKELSGSALKSFEIPIPHKAEQQKIADCLTSLDDLIRLEAEKLEALKTHKKGLMQQLFPAEGETVPKLRFPEFRGMGEWELEQFGSLGTFIGGGTPNKSVDAYWNGTIPWVSSSDILEDDVNTLIISRYITATAVSESATKIVPMGSLLFVSRVGIGKVAIADRDVCTSQDFTSFQPKSLLNSFIAYFFSANKQVLKSFGQGTSIKGFTKEDLAKFQMPFPSRAEQQKIADCLSALDTQIATQAEKIESLKTHKKGLMQQLFPVLDEVQA